MYLPLEGIKVGDKVGVNAVNGRKTVEGVLVKVSATGKSIVVQWASKRGHLLNIEFRQGRGKVNGRTVTHNGKWVSHGGSVRRCYLTVLEVEEAPVPTEPVWEESDHYILNNFSDRVGRKRKIATLVVPNDFDRYRCGEYGADFWTDIIHAGEYPVYEYDSYNYKFISAPCDGTLKSSSPWAKRDAQVGKPKQVSIDVSVENTYADGVEVGIENLKYHLILEEGVTVVSEEPEVSNLYYSEHGGSPHVFRHHKLFIGGERVRT